MSINDKDKYNILVVDDDSTVTDLICETLGDDYNMYVALAGAEGLVLATQNEPPDLIILDINLPGKDGHMVAEQLCQNETSKGIPIIFITGLRDDNEVVKSYEVGGNDLVFKPINVRILKEKVKAHLRDYITRKDLKLKSITDPVTHLHNTRGFNAQFKNLWLTARVLSQPISLTFISLDNLEDIPRYSGINNREDLLRSFARKLTVSFEQVHCEIACYSGSLFTVVAINKTTDELKDKLHSLYDILAFIGGEKQEERLFVSAGIAAGTLNDFANSEALKIAADRAWLAARQENKTQQGLSIQLV